MTEQTRDLAGAVERLDLLVAALRAPSFEQDSAWHTPKAVYATKPRDLLIDAADTIVALVDAGWRPIETAPRDFTPIIGWREGGVRQWYRWVDDRHSGTGWYNSEWGRVTDKPPTHWMPLPAPPAIVQAYDQGGGGSSVAESAAVPKSSAPDAAALLERAAKICEQQARDFLSPKYASEQPMGSFCERFACDECAKAIRAEILTLAKQVTP